MKKILLGWLLAASLSHGQAQVFKVAWCPGSAKAKKELAESLNKIPNHGDLTALKPVFERWAKEQGLPNAVAVVQRGNQTFRWPMPGTNQVAPYNARTGVLGTRSVGRPSNDEIACFFRDTLVIVDTLRFFTGRSGSVRFLLKINNKDYELPRDSATGELLLSAAALSNPVLGAYQSATMWVVVGQQRQEQARGTLYLFSPGEKRAFLEALRNRQTETLTCEGLLNESMAFLQGFWGGKQCPNSEPHDHAQREALRRLLKCP